MIYSKKLNNKIAKTLHLLHKSMKALTVKNEFKTEIVV